MNLTGERFVFAIAVQMTKKYRILRSFSWPTFIVYTSYLILHTS